MVIRGWAWRSGAVLAAWRYHIVNRAIHEGRTPPRSKNSASDRYLTAGRSNDEPEHVSRANASQEAAVPQEEKF